MPSWFLEPTARATCQAAPPPPPPDRSLSPASARPCGRLPSTAPVGFWAGCCQGPSTSAWAPSPSHAGPFPCFHPAETSSWRPSPVAPCPCLVWTVTTGPCLPHPWAPDARGKWGLKPTWQHLQAVGSKGRGGPAWREGRPGWPWWPAPGSPSPGSPGHLWVGLHWCLSLPRALPSSCRACLRPCTLGLCSRPLTLQSPTWTLKPLLALPARGGRAEPWP